MNNLGQETGGDPLANAYEARQLVKMIMAAKRDDVVEYCGPKALSFVSEQVSRLSTSGERFSVSGKQLFWLRDIKDKLVENGRI